MAKKVLSREQLEKKAGTRIETVQLHHLGAAVQVRTLTGPEWFEVENSMPPSEQMRNPKLAYRWALKVVARTLVDENGERMYDGPTAENEVEALDPITVLGIWRAALELNGMTDKRLVDAAGKYARTRRSSSSTAGPSLSAAPPENSRRASTRKKS